VISIRRFLLARLLLGAAAVLLLAALAVSFAVTRSLESQFDENLSERVRALSSLLFQTKAEVQFEFSDQLMPEYSRAERPCYFELRHDDGRLLERSDSLHGAVLEVPRELGDGTARWTARLPDGRSGRFSAERVELHHVFPEEGPDRPPAARVTVAVAAGREELLAAERSAIAICAGGSLGVLVLLALIARAAVDRGLAPANRLAARLDAIRVEDLPDGAASAPLPPVLLEIDELPSELRPIGRTLEQLLERTVTALRRERRTAADIAHELRTPISEIVAISDVALRDPRDPASPRRALVRARAIAWRMGRSVSALLKLARLEMGAEAAEPAPVDAGALVAEVLRALRETARERDLCVENRVEPGEIVLADPDVLRIALSNLLSNALLHAPSGGTVECDLARPDGSWCVRVRNPAPDLRPDDVRSLSEPFWRKDPRRKDPRGGERSGLGLALSRALAERAELELAFELEDSRLLAEIRGRDGSGGRAANGHAPPSEHRADP
jgi:two-component system sensor histidine kinase QseC